MGAKVHFTFAPAEAINESSDHNIRRPCCWRCIGGTLYAHNGTPEFNLYTTINSIIQSDHMGTGFNLGFTVTDAKP